MHEQEYQTTAVVTESSFQQRFGIIVDIVSIISSGGMRAAAENGQK